jgi:hypothetical protein
MRGVLAAGLVLATTAGAMAQPLGMPGTAGCAQYQAAFPALTGLTEAEAIAALEKMPAIRTVRAGGPTTTMTRDYRPDRATLLLRDGKVERITCG